MVEKPFRPLLAGDADFKILTWPKLASPKLDGIRCHVSEGVGLSRSNLPIPNRHIQAYCRNNADFLDRLDGELIVGSPTDPEVYNKTNSGVMSVSGEPDFAFYVFDRIPEDPTEVYIDRLNKANSQIAYVQFYQRNMKTCKLANLTLHSQLELDGTEEGYLKMGYEGVMLRDPRGLYKQGRSTAREQILLKVKRWSDAEGTVVGYKERQHNTNEKVRSELGLAKRSSAKAGMVGTGMLGALTLKGINDFEGLEFDASGFTHARAMQFWDERESLVGRIVKYKYFNVGIKNLPRFPGFLGFRDARDM